MAFSLTNYSYIFPVDKRNLFTFSESAGMFIKQTNQNLMSRSVKQALDCDNTTRIAYAGFVLCIFERLSPALPHHPHLYQINVSLQNIHFQRLS